MSSNRSNLNAAFCAILLYSAWGLAQVSVAQSVPSSAQDSKPANVPGASNVPTSTTRSAEVLPPKPKDGTGGDADEHEIAIETKYLAWATFILAFVGAVQVRYLIKADRSASRSAQAAGDSAKAAQAAVDGAERTAERQLRAYLSITRCEYTVDVKAKCYRAKYRLKNVGQTPAFHISVRGYAFVTAEEPTLDALLLKLDASVAEPKSVQFPAQLAFGNRAGEPLSYDPKATGLGDPIGKNGARLYVIVEIRYTDAFGRQRFTRRCRRTASGKAYLSTYRLGNDAT